VIAPDLQKRITQAVEARAAELGLRFDPQQFRGEHMVFPDGRVLRLDMAPGYWRDVAADAEPAIIAAAVELIEGFAARHGPGLVWNAFGLPPVHLVNDDGRTIVDGKVRIRRYLAHEATKTANSGPDA
jgi:hypothetical protein